MPAVGGPYELKILLRSQGQKTDPFKMGKTSSPYQSVVVLVRYINMWRMSRGL